MSARVQEALELVFEIADGTPVEGNTVAVKVVDLGREIAETYGGDVGTIVARILGALPLEELMQWLESFRVIAVEVRNATIELGEGLNASVDIGR